MIDVLEFEYRNMPFMLRFFMKTEAYVPEQMAFRNVKVDGKGRIIKENHEKDDSGRPRR